MTPESERHEGSELRARVNRGAKWVLASQGVTQVLALVTSIVVARFLGPHEVGLAAAALVFSSLALVIVDFGFASVLVQRPKLTDLDLSTVFWTGFVLGCVLTGVGVLLAQPIAELYGEPEIESLFAVLSLSFLFTAPGIVQGAVLGRELRFRSLEVRTMIATAASCVAGMALAAAGVGAWAIVAQHLVITSVSTALLWRSSPWRPSFAFSWGSLRSMSAFTGNVFGTRVLIWASLNLDNFLVGRYLGAGALGAYSIAFNLMTTPLRRIASPLVNVLFPAFSRMQDRDRVGAAWLRSVGVMAAITVPITLGVIPIAPELIRVLFGEEWDAAAPLLQILAGVGLIHSLAALNDGVLQALDRTRILFRFTLVLSVASVAAFVFAVQWSVEAVAWAYLIVTVALQPVLLLYTAREANRTLAEWLRSVSGVMQAGVAMALVVLGVRALVQGAGLGEGGELALMLVAGAATYLPLLAWRAPDVVAEFRAAIAQRRGQPAQPPTTGSPVADSAPGPGFD